jgi:hypothetical protein
MRYFSIFFLFLITFTGCQKVKTDIPDTGRKIVINGLISSDSLLNIGVRKSSFIIDNIYSQTGTYDLDSAIVSIYQSGSRVDSLYHSDSRLDISTLEIFKYGNYWSKRIFPIPGQKYEIVVKANGMPDATAITTIPDMVRIEHVDSSRKYQTIYPYPFYLSNVSMIFNIEFTDPVYETNYYLLNVCKVPNYSTPWSTNIGFGCTDPVVEEELGGTYQRMAGIAFTDKVINGKKYSLTLTVDGNEIGQPFWDDSPRMNGIPLPDHKKTIYLRLYSITEEYFRYIQTLNLFEKDFGDPLTNPVQVFSNVTGGFGIFAGAAVSSDSIVFNY